MKLYNMFNITLDEGELLSFVGAGGKTTTIFKLAKELRALNKKVLVTTSTAIYYPKKRDYDKIILNDCSFSLNMLAGISYGTITVIGKNISRENKLVGLDRESIDRIYENQIFDYILVEADGSKRRPIKAPANHEPVIPKNTDKIIGVIGMDAINKKINEANVHRTELFCKITKSKMEEEINLRTVIELIKDKEGLFKDSPMKSKRYVLLNKVDTEKRQVKAIELLNLLKKSSVNMDGIIAADIKTEKCIYKWSDQ